MRMLARPGELQRANDLFDHLIQTRRLEDHRPEVVGRVVGLGGQLARTASGSSAGEHVGLRHAFTFLQLVQDVAGADHGVLQVGPVSPSKLERLLDVEHDQLAARELQHEIPDRADRNLRAGSPALLRA